MRYIKNAELRDWVKDNLRKAIFQKAHALAIQTGCEVLVKLQDGVDTSCDSQSYATGTLQKAYYNKRLTRSPGEVSVSGETGLPVVTQVDRASQSRSTGMPSCADVLDLGGRPQDGVGASTDDQMDEDDVEEEGTLKENDLDEGITADAEQEQVQESCDTNVDHLQDAESVGDKVIKNEMPQMACSVDEENSAGLLKPMISKTTTEIGSSAVESEPQDTVDMDVAQLSSSRTNTMNADSSANRLPVMLPSVGGFPDGSAPAIPERVMSPSIRPYQCGVCQKTFGSIQVLSRHAQTFHGMNRGMRYYCNICGQSYKLAQYLQAHVKMHDTVSVMPILCKICGMGYYSQAALRQHELTHSSSSAPVLPVLEPAAVHTVNSPAVHTIASPPHTMTSPSQHVMSSTQPTATSHSQHTVSSPPHTITSGLVHTGPDLPTIAPPVPTVTSPPEHAVTNIQSIPNPRFQLAKTTPISTQKPSLSTGASSKPNWNTSAPPPLDIGHSPPEPHTGHSPPEAKRFKPTSSTDESKEESYHEPKQYHCLVCGMAFEEGEQLEEHVLSKHMQGDSSQEDQKDQEDQTADISKPPVGIPDDITTSNEEPTAIKLEDSEEDDEEDYIPLQSSTDYPGIGDASASQLMQMPPFSAAASDNFAMYQQQQLFQGSFPNPNPNITSVLEQALPGLLPGISLLSNPTQLPMSHMAAAGGSNNNPDMFPPMVSQDGRFTCDICGNSYKYNCTLKEHRLTHAQTPLFSCKICNQAFSRQRQLRDHMFRHSGAYPYHCKLCGKGFVRPSILRRHETDRHKQAWENIS